MTSITPALLTREIVFVTSRSGGPGGQNVNKVNSKVTLQFDVWNSQILTEEQKKIIGENLSTRITREGLLVIPVQESRSQAENKEISLKKFAALLARAFAKKKTRKATNPSKTSKLERLKKKKVVSEKKKWRKKGNYD